MVVQYSPTHLCKTVYFVSYGHIALQESHPIPSQCANYLSNSARTYPRWQPQTAGEEGEGDHTNCAVNNNNVNSSHCILPRNFLSNDHWRAGSAREAGSSPRDLLCRRCLVCL